MDAKIADTLASVDSARRLYVELLENFGQTNGAMLFQLRRSLVSIQKGHSKERCYKIIGYPDNWKFKDQRPDHWKNGDRSSGWKNKEKSVNLVILEDTPFASSSANSVNGVFGLDSATNNCVKKWLVL